MPTGYNDAGQANSANSEGEVAYGAVTFTPQGGSIELVAVGTAQCKLPGLASVKVEFKQGAQPWQPAGFCSGSGTGRVALEPTSTALAVMPNQQCRVRVVIEGANTETSEAEDYFSITLLELEPPDA